ncbi:hypothetical protein BDV12DRAFT_194287 [Aspergillus spectabilis]
MGLIPNICTHEVSLTVITSILRTTYEASAKVDLPPSRLLLLLTTSDGGDLREYTYGSVTTPPVKSVQSLFLGWTLTQIAEFLQKNTENAAVRSDYVPCR